MPRRRYRRALVILGEGQLDVFPGVRQGLRANPQIQALILLTNPWSTGEADRLGQFIRSLRPDGILAHVLPSTESVFRGSGGPVVCLGDGVDSSWPTVRMDQQAIGRWAAEHLAEEGLRHLAFAAIEGYFHAQLRWEGFRQAALSVGIQPQLADTFLTSAGKTGRGGQQEPDWVLPWIQQLPKPVGIHFRDTALTLRALGACQDLGLNVPGDVALVAGEDNLLWRQMDVPGVSAIETDRARLGLEAIALLCRLLRGERPPQTPILIPPVRVVCRDSSDRLALRDPIVAEFRRRIRQDLHRSPSVKELLSGFPCSRRTLERHVAQVLHRSPHQELEAAHVDYASTLMRDTTLSLRSVAQASGYRSYRVFPEAFRRYLGVTPAQYRASRDVRQPSRDDLCCWTDAARSGSRV